LVLEINGAYQPHHDAADFLEKRYRLLVGKIFP
jgi:hypothetical protein